MKGTLVNVAAVLAGSGAGLLLKRGIPDKYHEILMQGIGLAVLLIGMQMAFKTHNVLIVIFSLVGGGLIGESMRLDAGLNRLAEWLAARFKRRDSDFGQGFISASLVFCVGAMAIVGSIQDGLTGDASTLYAKSILDGVTSVVFASTMGAGVALSAITVLIYQGIITLLAGWIGSGFTAPLINEITAVGGLLIFAIGLNLLKIKIINVANLLPAIPVAAILVLMWPA